ncbi:ArnT family glycosyltransferase [Pedobacter sp. AW31-3R]|uniref:ArnT family glycosyltransferase n=1 Tax=Pedobacter sp. AW31-3R TaxID=3445781 RepID=UPI003FA12D19
MQEVLSDQRKQWLYLFIGLAVLLNFSGLFVTIMGPDAALYASIAKTMAHQNNFADLFVQGKDWLDKPHFPFWITALSFKIFGVHNWSYKLPGILFVLMAAWYTYRLAKHLYRPEVGLWAVLILLTSQHIVINNMDVRAEPYLTGLIMGSVYYFYRSLGGKWFFPLLLASVFAACAVMTKGIFALIPIGGAVAGELLIKKDWKMVFNFRWVMAFVLILIFVTPEIYTLYIQFDIHPEKLVFGRTGVSGVKFFFWDSQFGRFFNTGPIKKASGDPTFFLHTILWAYLPWALLLYAAIFQFFRKNFKQPAQAEWYCISGALLTLFIFSVSKFQLPFYITIVFPFFSILCAQYICGIKEVKSIKVIRIVQLVVGAIMVLLVAALHYFFRPDNLNVIKVLLLLVPVILFILVSYKGDHGRFRIFLQISAVAFFVNLYFNLAYYPGLLKYQADSEAAFWINAHNSRNLPVVQTRIAFGYPLEYYTHAPVYFYRDGEEKLLPQQPYLLYGEKENIDQLIGTQNLRVKRLHAFPSYRITMVKGKFLNHKTREETLTINEVVEVY